MTVTVDGSSVPGWETTRKRPARAAPSASNESGRQQPGGGGGRPEGLETTRKRESSRRPAAGRWLRGGRPRVGQGPRPSPLDHQLGCISTWRSALEAHGRQPRRNGPPSAVSRAAMARGRPSRSCSERVGRRVSTARFVASVLGLHLHLDLQVCGPAGPQPIGRTVTIKIGRTAGAVSPWPAQAAWAARAVG